MKTVRLVVLALSLSCGLQANAADPPTDVKKFLALRETCDHWRSESGYDKERQADIDWSVCQSCQGTDAELARLKKKYSGNPKVMETLAELEPEIEPKDKAAAKRFCKSTRKPKWQS